MGHSEVVRVMLLRGAERDAERDDGTTALLKAANKGYHAVIEELLKFSPSLGILKNGTSALHAAVLSGNIKTVALLLEAGADPALRNQANQLPAELTQNERILSLLGGQGRHRRSYLSCIFD
nr:ankyrin repeat domain 29 [Pipistrellus kuhlii]